MYSKGQVEVIKKLATSSDAVNAEQQCRNDQFVAGYL